MFWTIKKKIEWHFFFKQWRKQNEHNETVPKCYYLSELVKVGRGTYGELNVLSHNETNQLIIGDYCSIAPSVTFILSSDHSLTSFSTFPHKVKTLHSQVYEATSKGDIIIEDDVWIGYGAIILSGVHIHQGAVVAAGAVVAKDVPPYSIVAGVPSKVIKYRFDNAVIEELLNVDYTKITREFIAEHKEDFYANINDITQLDWLPKK